MQGNDALDRENRIEMVFVLFRSIIKLGEYFIYNHTSRYYTESSWKEAASTKLMVRAQ